MRQQLIKVVNETEWSRIVFPGPGEAEASGCWTDGVLYTWRIQNQGWQDESWLEFLNDRNDVIFKQVIGKRMTPHEMEEWLIQFFLEPQVAMMLAMI
jgi:hypothetical protein